MIQLDLDDPLSPLGISWPPDPPLPPLWPVWPPPPPPPSDGGGIVVALVIGFVAFLLVFACVGYRNSRARDASAAAAAAAAPVQGPPLPRQPGPAPVQRPRLPGPHVREDERELRRACTGAGNLPQPTDRLPAFTYSHRRRNVTGGGEESCSVCLAAFRLGETVRLLPVCLHLYHAECIDPWLDAHSTCPLCRSDADPSTDLSRLPPV